MDTQSNALQEAPVAFNPVTDRKVWDVRDAVVDALEGSYDLEQDTKRELFDTISAKINLGTNPFSQFNVTVSLFGEEVFSVTVSDVDSEEEATAYVLDDISIDDVSLEVSLSSNGEYGSFSGSIWSALDDIIRDNLDATAEAV